MPTEFAGRDYCSLLLGLGKRKTSRKLGPPDAIVINAGNRQTALWRIGRVYAMREGVTLPNVDEPARFYTLSTLVATTGGMKHRIKSVLGSPDSLQISRNDETPLYSEQSAGAVFQLSAESPEAFSRTYAFVPRVSAKQRKRIERMHSRPKDWWKRPARKVTFASPRHVWASDQRRESELLTMARRKTA